MTEYTYHNGILKIKSDSPVSPGSHVTIAREDTEKITTTVYRLGLQIKSETSGAWHYAWYEAVPQTVTVDNSPLLKTLLEERTAALEEALCEQDVEIDGRLSALEDAMCELDGRGMEGLEDE